MYVIERKNLRLFKTAKFANSYGKGRCVDPGHIQALFLKVKGMPTGTAPHIQDATTGMRNCLPFDRDYPRPRKISLLSVLSR